MVSEAEKAATVVEPLLEEAKQPRRGRPRKEITDDEAFRRVSLKEQRAQTRALKGIRAMLGEGGGGRAKHVEIAQYFMPMQGMPASDALEAEVNRLIARYPAEGWYPLYVTSQPGTLDAEGGEIKGDSFTILWGHD